MREIIGNTTATPNPNSDWLQNDESKAGYIKNKPILGVLAQKSVVDKTDLTSDIQQSLRNADVALQSLGKLKFYLNENGILTISIEEE